VFNLNVFTANLYKEMIKLENNLLVPARGKDHATQKGRGGKKKGGQD